MIDLHVTHGDRQLTPELRRYLVAEARSLQRRLTLGRIDPMTAATEARRLFTEANDAPRVRWLGLELGGYAGAVVAAPLHAVLGIPAGDRLVAHVNAYRTQRGRAKAGEFSHFFVESLSELMAASAKVATSGGTSELELDFEMAPGDATHPRRGAFRRDVFQRIVSGFLAALHLQLGTLVK